MTADFSSSPDFDQAAARMAALAAEMRSLDEPMPAPPVAASPAVQRPATGALHKGVRIETSAPAVPHQAAAPVAPAKGGIAETAVLLRMQSDAEEEALPPRALPAQPQPAAKPGRGRFSLKRWFE